MKNKSMLFLLLMIQFVFLTSCNSKQDDVKMQKEISFAVATDIHVFANSLLNEENIQSYSSTDKMIHLSEPILHSITDEVVTNGYSFLLLAGDLTERGDMTSHIATAKILKEVENSGVNVYVINGNHDVMSTNARRDFSVTQSEFMDIYSDFGYNEADSILEGTLCYSLPIMNTFRLIALDNISYYIDNNSSVMTDEISEEKCDWICKQVEKASSEGLIPILLSHKGFISHWPKIQELLKLEDMPEGYNQLCSDILLRGSQIGFVGHSHLNDIKSFGNDDNLYYEVLTGSTCYCQANYRSVTLRNDILSVRTSTLNKVNLDYISPVVEQCIINEIESDFELYAYKLFSSQISSTIKGKFRQLFSKLKIDNSKVNSFFTNDLIDRLFSMSLYGDDEFSIQIIVSAYGISLPTSDYKTVSDVFSGVVGNLIRGNENMSLTNETTFLKYIFYSLIYVINQNSDLISSFTEDAIHINIDMEKMFQTGQIECYESNLIPAIISILSQSKNTTIKTAIYALQTNFRSIELVSDALSGLSDGTITDIERYFTLKEIWIDKLIEEGFFNNYISDLITDKAPNDREIDIVIKKE